MIKRLITFLTLACFLTAHTPSFADETYYYDEDEEYFNKGTIVGEDTGEYQRAVRRSRIRNWGLAVSTTLVGVATVILVGNNQSK